MGLVTIPAEKIDWQSVNRSQTSAGSPGRAGQFSSALKSAAGKSAGSLEDIFKEASALCGVSEELLKAVAKAESNFNPSAVSKAGAMGVMQLMPGTARSLGVSDPFDARQNILGGAKYLKEQLERFGGSVSLALAAYNAGPGNVEKYGGIPPFEETQNYVKKILADLGDGFTENLSGRSVCGMGGLMGYPAAADGLWNLFLSGLDGQSLAGGDGTVTLDKDAYVSLVEMLRLQMMSQGMDVGDTLL